MSVQYILEILERAHRGPLCTNKEWSTRIIPTKVAQNLKAHALQGTFDPENPINTDDELADSFYRAGYELALELGILCLDTERIIKVPEEEIVNTIRNTPTELILGKGRDAVVLKHRKPEDTYPPLFRSPMSNMVSEEIWIPLNQGIIEHREVDILQGASILSMYGHAPLSNTPYETLLGRHRAQLIREVLWRAGRPGTCVGVTSGTGTPFGQLGGFGIPGGFDPAKDYPVILADGELVTSYASLHKVIHAINCNAKILFGYQTLIGGSAGSPEGAAVAGIAAGLLLHTIHQSHICCRGVVDARYSGCCGREGQWSLSVQDQALSRNTPLIIESVISQRAGPCTEMLLHESAVGMLLVSTSGASINIGPRTSGVKYLDHLSPLECKFCGEMLKKSAGMTRKQANEISKILTPKFEDKLWDPPIGKRFQDCYDMKTLMPIQEWLDIYLRVKRELMDMGVPLAYP